MTVRRFTIELGKLTELLAAGDVAGAQKLLDRHAGRPARRVGRLAAQGTKDAASDSGTRRVGRLAAQGTKDAISDSGTRRDRLARRSLGEAGSPAAQDVVAAGGGDGGLAAILARRHGEAGRAAADGSAEDDTAAEDPASVAGGAAGEAVSLADACPGREVTVATPLGERAYWLVDGAVADVLPDEAPIEAEYAAVLRGARQRFDELSASAALCHLADGGPGDPLFMDIETCGLSGAMIFLVGLMRFTDGRLVYAQHLARDYAEETAVLAAVAEALPSAGALVTFNGKSFDMPMIRERSIIHRVELPPADGPPEGRMPPHLDLLHEARPRWKGQLPNCRLQTLESCLCRRARSGDIPGGDIPDAYHQFVREGDARRLRAIGRHNLLDMLTMVQLVCILLTSCEADGD